MNIVILASGVLGARCVREILKNGHQVVAILTDARSGAIGELASLHKIPLFCGNPRNGKATTFLDSNKIAPDLLLSINYLFLIEKDVIDRPRLGAVNFHGSLLPKYRGRTPHVWAIINNEVKTGITAHIIVEECDAGPIVEQLEVEILPGDTGADVLNKYGDLYPDFVERVIQRFGAGKVNPRAQDHAMATFFGQRTPDSGRIDWAWQRERINNWVRAQASPYPGAFTYMGQKKVTIDQVAFDDCGFDYQDQNGKVVAGGRQPIIKTPNGCLKLLQIREDIIFATGEMLI